MKISCIVPTCDRPDYLKDTLSSILKQTFQAHEVIVVNNGKSQVVLPEEFKDKVKVYDIIPYAGVAQARNFGVCMATGDYVAFLDDDDMWSETYLEKVSEAFSTGAKCAISNMHKLIEGEVLPYKNPHGKVTISNLLTFNPGTGGVNIVLEKHTFFSLGGYDPKLPPSEDKALILEALLKNVPIVTLPDNPVIVRMHSGPRLTGNKRIIEGITQFTRKYRPLMSYRQYLANRLKIFKYKLADGNHVYLLPRVIVSGVLYLYKIFDLAMSLKKRLGDYIRNRPVRVHDGTQYLWVQRWISRSLSRHKEGYTMELFEQHCKPGNVFIDIGANIGEYTLAASRIVGRDGRVYAFEPDPRNYKILKRNIAANGQGNITSIQSALGDKNGQIDFHLDVDPSESSLYRLNSRAHAHVRSIRVPVSTLDKFVSDNGLVSIDIVKIDAEGSEPVILSGMREAILKHRPSVMFVEFYPRFLQDAGTNPTSFLNDLATFGFEIFGIDEERRETIPDFSDVWARGGLSTDKKRINLLLIKK